MQRDLDSPLGLDFDLDSEQIAWREQVRSFARENVTPHSRTFEEAHNLPRPLFEKMAKEGLLGVNIPESLGGAERGVVAYAIAMREMSRADSSVAVTMAVTNMAAEVIVHFGTEEQKMKHVPKITSGKYFAAAFALSEPGAGSDAAALSTKAERTSKGWILNGEKMWITSGDIADVFIVWARTGGPGAGGISCFLVEKGTQGFSAGKPEEKMGLRASHTTSLTFEDVEVGEDALLGELGKGFKVAMVALDGGRIGVSSQAVGIGEAALERARQFAVEESAGGTPLANEQAVQFQLADVATELDAAWLLALRAASMKQRKVRFSREAAMAKAFASEAANRATRTAVEIAGSRGILNDYIAPRLLRDCRVTQIYEGTSEVQRLVISREVLKSGVLP